MKKLNEEYNVLGKERELELFIALENGDESVINLIVEGNLRLALQIGNKFASRNKQLDKDDVIQQASIELIECIKKFDYTLNNKFSTFATNYIENRLNRELLGGNNLGMKFSDDNEWRIRKIKKVREELKYEMGCEPDIYTLADAVKMSVEQVKTFTLMDYDKKEGSIINEDGTSIEFINVVKDENVDIEEEVSKRDLIAYLISEIKERVNERDFDIFMMKFDTLKEYKNEKKKSLQISNKEIARVYGLNNNTINDVFKRISKVAFDIINEMNGVSYNEKKEQFQKEAFNEEEVVVNKYLAFSKKKIKERLEMVNIYKNELEVNEIINTVKSKIKNFEDEIKYNTLVQFKEILN